MGIEKLGMQYAQLGFSFFVAIFFIFVVNRSLGCLKGKVRDLITEIKLLKSTTNATMEDCEKAVDELTKGVQSVAEGQKILTAILQNRRGG